MANNTSKLWGWVLGSNIWYLPFYTLFGWYCVGFSNGWALFKFVTCSGMQCCTFITHRTVNNLMLLEECSSSFMSHSWVTCLKKSSRKHNVIFGFAKGSHIYQITVFAQKFFCPTAQLNHSTLSKQFFMSINRNRLFQHWAQIKFKWSYCFAWNKLLKFQYGAHENWNF